MDAFKIAIAGLGNAGQAIHVPVVVANKRAVLAGFFDPRKNFAKKYMQYAKKKGIIPPSTQPVIYPSYRALLDDASIDAVIICTPHEFHVPMSQETLKAGKAVLCEKPLCTSLPEARDFLAYLGKEGLENRFSLGYMWTRDPSVLVLKAFIDKQEHGFTASPISASQFFLTGDPDSWLGGFKPLKAGGNPAFKRFVPAVVTTPQERQAFEWFINVMSHASNLMQALFKTPVSIGDARIWNGGNSFTWTEDHGAFKSMNYFSWVTGKEFQRGLRVLYESSAFDLRFPPPITKAPGQLEITEGGSTMPVILPEPATWAYAANFELFLDLIEGTASETVLAEHITELQNAIADIQIATAFIEAAKTKQDVQIGGEKA